MAQWLKQSTAATIKFGPFVDDTDGKTAETGLTVAQANIRLTKNGGAFAQTHNSAGATHDENGYYGVPLDTTDTDTLGRLRVAASVSGALPVWQDFVVVAANVFDSLIGGGDVLDVSAIQILGTAISTPATAGILDVNLKNIANATVSTSTAQLGVNVVQISGDATAADNEESMFDGTGYAGGTIKLGVDAIAISGDTTAADNCEAMFDGTGYAGGTAKLAVNAVQCNGTSLTARDIGASVLLSSGTGTGQLDFTSGVVKANLAQILGSAITGTAAQLAAAFTKWFNVSTPTGTVNSLPDAVAGAAGGVFIAGTNAATTITSALTTTFTGNLTGSVASVTGAVGSVTGAVGSVTGAVGSVTGNVGGSVASVTGAVGSVTGNVGGSVASVTGAVGSVTGNVGGNVVGSVASVTGNVGGNVTGSVGSVATNGITATSIATDAINAAAVKADAVTKIQNGLATPTNITAGTITTVTNLTNAPTAGDFTATMKSSITAAVPTVAGIADGVWDEAIAGHAGAGSTGAALSAATAPSAATVADAVWDEAIAGHLTGGTTGAALNAAGSAGDPWVTPIPGSYTAGQAGYILGTNINATVGSRSSHSAADVWSVATRVLTANTNLNDPSAATIADAVWDEATAGHAGAGTTGLALTSASAPTAAAVADAVWDEATAGHTSAGTTGLALTSASAPTVGQIDTQLSATHGAGVWGGAAGSGSKSETITVTVGGSPQDGVNVWVTSDAGGATVVASGFTNASGQVTFLLDPGTYYGWCNRGGSNFTNPTTITVA